MRPFILRANMETGLSATQGIHLDGLLLAARERLEGVVDLDRPLDCLMLDRGVYRASMGIMVAPGLAGAAVQPVRRVWRFRVEDQQALSFFKAGPDSPLPERRLPTQNSKYRNSFRSQDVLTGVQSVVWQAVGEPDAVLALAREVKCLGASSVTGFGRVRSWEVEACDAPAAEAGWHAGGRALRNLPLDLAPEGAFDDNVVAFRDVQRARPPYWDEAGRVPCLVPTFDGLVMAPHRADEILRAA